jgi:hypothetical protein
VVKEGVLVESRNLVQVAGVCPQMGKVHEAVSVDAKGVVVRRVKTGERYSELYVRIRKRIAEKTPALRQASVQPVQTPEDFGVGVFVGRRSCENPATLSPNSSLS